jgi:hypothetical protein
MTPFLEHTVFTRKDLIDLSGLSVPRIKQYLFYNVVPSTDLPKSSDGRKIGRFAIPTTMRIVIMAQLSRDFGITPAKSSLIAHNLSRNCASMLREATQGRVERFPRSAGELPDTFTAWWTHESDFFDTDGIVASPWNELAYYDGQKHIVKGPEFAFMVIPDRHLWQRVIWPVVQRYERKVRAKLPLSGDLRRACAGQSGRLTPDLNRPAV